MNPSGDFSVEHLTRRTVFFKRSRITDPEILRHPVDPVCPLMGKDQRFIAVEIVYDTLCRREIKQRHRKHAVVAHAADHQTAVRNNAAHQFDIPAGQIIPCLRDIVEHDLIERLKRYLIRVILKALRDLAPQIQKPRLQCFIVEKCPPVHIFKRIK